jgi:nucleotide-binding universal stress UspA family protein
MDSSIATILVGLDFSDCSLYALDYAVNLSKIEKAKLHILYIDESSGNLNESLFHNGKGELTVNYKKKLSEVLAESNLKVNDIELVIKKGKYHKELINYTEKLNPDLVCIGTNSSHKVKSKNIGNNVLKLLSSIKYPVVLINDKTHSPCFENVLLPLNLAKEVNIDGLVSYFKRFHQCTVRIVCVANNVNDFELNKLTRQMTLVKNGLNNHHISNSGEIIRLTRTNAKVADVILDYQQKTDANVVAVTVKKHSTKNISGSAYFNVYNGNKLPVMSLLI